MPAPSAANRSFSTSPGSTLLVGTSSGGGLPDEPTGVFAFSASLYSVNEPDGTVTLTVTRDDSSGEASVDYTTQDGTAVAGTDYVAQSGTLTFAGGEASKQIVVGIIDDAVFTGDRSFSVALSNPTTGLGSPSEATVNILEDEADPDAPPAEGSIQHLGFSATPSPESAGTTIGWTDAGFMHDPDNQNPLFVWCFGYSHVPPNNSAVIYYDLLNDVWGYLQQDRSNEYPSTYPELGNLDDVVCNRNNHAQFFADFCSQIWTGGGFTEIEDQNDWQPMNHGIMFLSERNATYPGDRNWKYIWRGDGNLTRDFGVSAANGGSMLKGDPGYDIIKGVDPNTSNVMTAINAATAVNNTLRCFVRVGGLIYKTNNVTDAFTNMIAVWEQNPDGPEEWVYYEEELPNGDPAYPPQINAARGASACCAGENFYVYCRRVQASDDGRQREFWRFHIPTRTWTRLAKCPLSRLYASLVYVESTNQIVMLCGGDGSVGGTDDANAATNDLLVYDIATDQWIDYSADSTIRRLNMPLAAYWPTGDKIAVRGGTSGQTADGTANLSNTDLSTLEFFRVVNTEISVDDIEEIVDSGKPMGRNGKHFVLAPNPLNGRYYMFGGDYTAGDGGSSYKRQVWSMDPENGGLWTLEAGYCPQNQTDPWPRGRCEAGWIWHPGEACFYTFAGVYAENTSSFCGYDAATMNYAYVMRFHPDTRTWSIPAQDARPFSNIAKHGFYDYLRNRLITLRPSGGGSTLWAFNIGDGTWESIGSYGTYLWARGDQSRRGRKLFFVAENEAKLIAFDLDSQAWEDLGLLPEDPHADDASGGLFAPQGMLAYWGRKDVLAFTHHYRRNAIWFYDCRTQQWISRVLAAPSGNDILGTTLFASPLGGPLVWGTRNDLGWNEDRPYWLIHDLEL